MVSGEIYGPANVRCETCRRVTFPLASLDSVSIGLLIKSDVVLRQPSRGRELFGSVRCRRPRLRRCLLMWTSRPFGPTGYDQERFSCASHGGLHDHRLAQLRRSSLKLLAVYLQGIKTSDWLHPSAPNQKRRP